MLIVGGNANLARYLIRVFPKSYKVVTAGRNKCDITLDVCSDFDLPQHTYDIVLYIAAYYSDKTIEDKKLLQQVNIEGACKVLEKAKNIKHFIYVSTIFSQLREDSPFYSGYARTKQLGEVAIAEACRQKGTPLTILRPSQFYSSDLSYENHQPFFYQLIRTSQKGIDHTLYGSHDPKRNFLHVDDFSQVVYQVIDQQIFGVFDCLDPTDISYSELIELANSTFESKGKVIFDKSKPNIADNVFPISNELFQKIGFYPSVDKASAIKKIGEVLGVDE